jgi:hypothetical protein
MMGIDGKGGLGRGVDQDRGHDPEGPPLWLLAARMKRNEMRGRWSRIALRSIRATSIAVPPQPFAGTAGAPHE